MTSLHQSTSDFDRKVEENAGLRTTLGWYARWYLRLRLEEETFRAGRHGRELAVLGIAVSAQPVQIRELTATMQRIAKSYLRVSDLPGVLDEDTYMVVLPETECTGALELGKRLEHTLRAFSPVVVRMSFPHDGRSAAELIWATRERLSNPGQLAHPSNVRGLNQ